MCTKDEYEMIQREAINLKDELLENKAQGKTPGYHFENTSEPMSENNICRTTDISKLKEVRLKDIRPQEV